MPDPVSPDTAHAVGRGVIILKWLLVRVPIYYAVALVLITLLQRRMVYHPTKLAPKEAEGLAAQSGFRPWKNSRGETIGWHLPHPGGSNGAVLVVHGNSGCAAERDYLAAPIRAAGAIDVFVLEYPGFGARGGSPTMKSLLAAADEAFGLLSNRSPLYVVSESLGTGMSAHLAKQYRDRVSGVHFFVPYNNLVSVAKRRQPIFPVSLLLWDQYAPDEWLADYHGPAGFALAGLDRDIPPALGQKLFDSYRGPKKLWMFEGAGHNDVAEQSVEWWKGVFEFWRSNAAH